MKKQSVLFILFSLLFALFPAISLAKAAEPTFSDISTNDWFYDGVQYTYEHGYMNGTGSNHFSPELSTTRAMLVTILYRVEGEPSVPVDHGFSDVKAEDYFNRAVMWAGFNGIVNGYSATNFGPNDPITREQMATILFRYAAMKGYDVSSRNADLSIYSDAKDISPYALEAMQWANGTKLILGIDSLRLAPGETTIRAQMAVILSRFCQKYMATEFPSTSPAEGSGSSGSSNSGSDNHTGLRPTTEPTKPAGINSNEANLSAENLFLLSASSVEGRTVELTLKLCGEVELCGFDLRLLFDTNSYSLKTLDTDYDLQIFSSRSDETGSVSLNYSAAKNITKEKTLLKAVFECLPNADSMAVFSLSPVEIIMTDETYEVVDANYTLTYCTALPEGGTP